MSRAYTLDDDKLLQCARLCYQEQGTVKGAAAEMSLALNLYEKNAAKFTDVYQYMRYSGWFANAAYYMANGKCPGAVLAAVADVLDGNRTLPEYIDEHDCFSDIREISTGDVYDRAAYIKDVTQIHNAYGAIYTFYCFPDDGADPFGYTGKPKPNVADQAAAWMEELAADDSHGYSQENRWGPDYDCSSAVISAYKQAGIALGCTYTGDMRDDMITKGFADVTAQVNLVTGEGLLRGDVLLNEAHHTAMYIGDGKEAEASVNELGKATGGKVGDQTGKEILVRSYHDYPWDCVLRYVGTVMTEPKEIVKARKARVLIPYVQKGNTGAMVEVVQAALNVIGDYGLEVDGEFGANTDKAVRGYQDSQGIAVSGICGISTFKRIMQDLAERTYVD